MTQPEKQHSAGRRGRLAEAALHAVEPLVALPVVLVLHPYGLVGSAPLPVTVAPFVLFGLLEQPAVLDRLGRGRLGRWRSLGASLHMIVVGWIVYVLGWGPVLPLAFALVATQHIRARGSWMWRPMAAWTAICIAVGQLGTALGWIPCYLDPVPAQVAGLLGLMLTVMFIRVLGRSIGERERAEAEVSRSAAHFRELVQDSTDVVAVLSPAGTVAYLSPAIRNVTGYPPEVYQTGDYRDHIHADDRGIVTGALAEVADRPGDQVVIHLRVRHEDGDWRWLEASLRNLTGNPAIGGIVVTFRDVTARMALQEKLAYEASHDNLTGLINRAAFLDGLAESPALGGAGTDSAVLFIDLDGFKAINDTYGHRYGDALLVSVSGMLRRCVPNTARVGRLGGDEFAVHLSAVDSSRQAVAVAERILAEMEQPVVVDGTRLQARASIGVAVGGRDCPDVAQLLHHADLAMYDAKRSREHRVQVHTPASNPAPSLT